MERQLGADTLWSTPRPGGNATLNIEPIPPVSGSLLFVLGGIASFVSPSATAPLYLGGSITMLVNATIGYGMLPPAEPWIWRLFVGTAMLGFWLGLLI